MGVTDENGRNWVAYDYENCTNLAKVDSDSAVQNPNNIVTFGLGRYLSLPLDRQVLSPEARSSVGLTLESGNNS